MTCKAIYSGTFDPITLGHVNILEKAARLFEKVILAVADYTGKENLFSFEERIRLCIEAVKHIPNVEVLGFEGLAVEFARKQECRVMIRGLRAVSDFEYELALALTNTKLDPGIETIFLVPSLRYMYLSSSMIRQLAELGSELNDSVPENVARALVEKHKDG